MAVSDDAFDRTWRQLAEEVLSSMGEWRREHPEASLSEIEGALDTRLLRLRAQVLQDAVQASPAARFQQTPVPERPVCPKCQTPLSPRGHYTRHLQTDGGQQLAFARDYGTCPTCGGGLFPPG